MLERGSDTLATELLAFFVLGFGEAVGVEEDCFAGAEVIVLVRD